MYPFPEKGYYVSNQITGIISKCHDNCLSCKNGTIEESGKLISMECLECKNFNT